MPLLYRLRHVLSCAFRRSWLTSSPSRSWLMIFFVILRDCSSTLHTSFSSSVIGAAGEDSPITGCRLCKTLASRQNSLEVGGLSVKSMSDSFVASTFSKSLAMPLLALDGFEVDFFFIISDLQHRDNSADIFATWRVRDMHHAAFQQTEAVKSRLAIVVPSILDLEDESLKNLLCIGKIKAMGLSIGDVFLLVPFVSHCFLRRDCTTWLDDEEKRRTRVLKSENGRLLRYVIR